jgi:hypothetical protein
MKASSSTLQFTAAERARFDKRMRRSQALLAKMLDASEEECVRLDDEFMRSVRAENRINRTRDAKHLLTAATPKPRNRERRSARTRRTSSSSTTSSSDPGDPEGDLWAILKEYQPLPAKRCTCQPPMLERWPFVGWHCIACGHDRQAVSA